MTSQQQAIVSATTIEFHESLDEKSGSICISIGSHFLPSVSDSSLHGGDGAIPHGQARNTEAQGLPAFMTMERPPKFHVTSPSVRTLMADQAD